MNFIKSLILLFCLSSFIFHPLLQAKFGKHSSSQADYVIVGVGTSGAVLAKSSPTIKKLLLLLFIMGKI